MTADVVVRRIPVLLTMDPRVGRGPMGRIDNAAVAIQGSTVAWVGPDGRAPSGSQTIDGRDCIALPGLIDCHTHTIWAGSRSAEFERRLAGESYSAILEAGGGILSTVACTRSAPVEELAEVGARRLSKMLDLGVTTVEIKSGYGLDTESEVRILDAAQRAGDAAGVRVCRTFLGAHAIPAEFRGDRHGYVRDVIERQLPAAARRAEYVDVYVDRGAFTIAEGRAILEAGLRFGLIPRVHAEQVAHTGAARLAAELGASSADHLERVDDEGIAAMARAGTTAVLLPGAMLYLRDVSPPVDRLRSAGVRMAVATDFNPGTSPVADLWACATLACVIMGLTVEEALRGVTVEAAAALQKPTLGRVAPGCEADIVLFEPPPGETFEPSAMIQHMGGHRASTIIRSGQPVRVRG